MSESKQQNHLSPRPTPTHSLQNLNHIYFPHTPAITQHFNYENHLRLNPEIEGVIYGTNIAVNETVMQIEHFLSSFEVTLQKQDQIVSQKIYLAKLRDLQNIDSQQGDLSFNINAASHIHRYSKHMYLQLIYFPVEMISCFDKVLQTLYEKYFIQEQTKEETKQRRINFKQSLRVGIINLKPKDRISIKNLTPNFLGRLISLRGIILRVSEILPEMKSAYFRCQICKKHIIVHLQNARVEEPKNCRKCKTANTLELIHNHCQFTNKQYIKFQQLLQNVGEGQTPSAITIISYDSNVDRMKPGDIVELVGIYRCHPAPVQKGPSVSYRQIFKTYFDLISFEMIEEKSTRIKVNNNNFTDDQKKQFLKMSSKPTVIQDLINSFAPSIYGHSQIKRGILAQLFGGSKKQVSKNRTLRSEINVCLVGDPSTAKSQMLQQVHKIAPRSIYTCGRGSSAVGLTANVRKDPETREFVLESGALVLSDNGICCIDQFDKMDPNTRQVLLEVMEQQTISIAKAGIVCQLNSRSAILAAANPINSKYQIKKSIIENINLPPALLSRFDLIYILLDIPNSEEDKRIAAHILDIYTGKTASKSREGIYSLQLLADYISFAKMLQPRLNDEAADKLQNQYVKLRAFGKNNKTITATPRLLESMIRLSESFAKMKLSTEVTIQDVQMAIQLINYATLKSATDSQTGIIDLDIIATGRTSLKKKLAKQISVKVKEILIANEKKYSVVTKLQTFFDDYQKMHNCTKQAITIDDVYQALKILSSEDFIYLFLNKHHKITFKLKQFSE